MIRRTALAFALVLMFSGLAAAQIAYVGSTTIAEGLIPEAAKAFTTKTGIPFGGIETQGSSKGLQMVLRGEAHLAGVSRSLTLEEKQRRFYYRIIGYDAVGVYVPPANPVTSLTKQQLKAIHTGQITNWNEVGGLTRRSCASPRIGAPSRPRWSNFNREDRKEFPRQPDQVAALPQEPYGIIAISPAFARPGVKTIAISSQCEHCSS